MNFPDDNSFQLPFVQEQSKNKFFLNLPNANTLMQLCEKQVRLFLPTSTTTTATTPATSLSSSSSSLSSLSSNSDVKQIDSINIDNDNSSHLAMEEYLQKLQATNLSIKVQQLMKLHIEPEVKKEKSIEDYEKTVDQPQNNILNIPHVPSLRNILNNSNQHYLNSDQLIQDLNLSDLTDSTQYLQQNSIISSNHQQQQQQQQSVLAPKIDQIDLPKTERKIKTKGKTGDVKIVMNSDGSMMYCCPECNFASLEKSDIDQHIQSHIQERKYHERPFKCVVCQKAFKRHDHLNRHCVIHSGDKNFSCQICQKAFSRKDHLKKHIQTHLGIRRAKIKKDSINIKDTIDDNSIVLKDTTKQDTFLQHLPFPAFKDPLLKDNGFIFHQHAVNMNEILPQNTRYL